MNCQRLNRLITALLILPFSGTNERSLSDDRFLFQVDLHNGGSSKTQNISGIFIKNVLPNSPAGRTGGLKVTRFPRNDPLYRRPRKLYFSPPYSSSSRVSRLQKYIDFNKVPEENYAILALIKILSWQKFTFVYKCIRVLI